MTCHECCGYYTESDLNDWVRLQKIMTFSCCKTTDLDANYLKCTWEV